MNWAVIASSAITGVVGISGAILGGRFTRRTEERRVANEDDRRWLADRRHVYAQYLRLVRSMISSLFYLCEGTSPLATDEKSTAEEARKIDIKWDDELQPLLSEIQLLAEPKVAEFADRTSAALHDLIGLIEATVATVIKSPTIDVSHWAEEIYRCIDKTKDLIDAMCKVMRAELGLADPAITHALPDGWPWLSNGSPGTAPSEWP